VAVFTLPFSYRTCIKWLIICGILTVLRVGWSLYCVVFGLIALAGSSPWITESWCVDAGAGGFFRLDSCTILFDDVTYSLCARCICISPKRVTLCAILETHQYYTHRRLSRMKPFFFEHFN